MLNLALMLEGTAERLPSRDAVVLVASFVNLMGGLLS